MSALAVVATMTMTASPASAQQPWNGALCRAAENIQFYTSTTTTASQSYKVYANEFIRVDEVLNQYWARGHGEGHSERYFMYRHSYGTDRLYGCYNT